MDGSKEQPQTTAGLDLGDKYSYLCLIDQENGEVIEEGRLRTTPDALNVWCELRSPSQQVGEGQPGATEFIVEPDAEVVQCYSRR